MLDILNAFPSHLTKIFEEYHETTYAIIIYFDSFYKNTLSIKTILIIIQRFKQLLVWTNVLVNGFRTMFNNPFLLDARRNANHLGRIVEAVQTFGFWIVKSLAGIVAVGRNHLRIHVCRHANMLSNSIHCDHFIRVEPTFCKDWKILKYNTKTKLL